MSDWLLHHGIPHQKWGVRNGPPYPLSRSKNKKVRTGTSSDNIRKRKSRLDRKREKAKANLQKNPVFIKSLDEKHKTWDFYKDLSHDRVIRKGSTALRISSVKNEKIRGGTFVSFDYYGNEVYKRWIRDKKKKKKVWNNVYEVEKDLKVPSTKRMAEVMIDTIMEDKKLMKKYLNEYSERRGTSDPLHEKIFRTKRNEFKNMLVKDPNKALVMAYSSILRSSSSDLGELGNAIHKKLMDEGFDAVPDMNDMSPNLQTSYYIFEKSDKLKRVDIINVKQNPEQNPRKTLYFVDYLDGEKDRKTSSKDRKQRYWD